MIIRDGWYLNFQVPNSVLYLSFWNLACFTLNLFRTGMLRTGMFRSDIGERILVIFWAEFIA